MEEAVPQADENWKPPLLSWALKTLRDGIGWNQDDLAAAANTTAKEISRYEIGKFVTLSREKFDHFVVDLMGYAPAAVEKVLFSLKDAREPKPPVPWSPVGPFDKDLRHVRRRVYQSGLANIDAAEQVAIRLLLSRRARRDRARAARFWSKHLRPCPPEKRGLLVAASPSFSTWALAVLLAHESERVACEDAKEALHLAELALSVAQEATAKVPEPWRFALLGYICLFVANARRVNTDLDGAEEAAAEGCALWDGGGDSAELLAAWRVPDLTASLRRNQRRFAEALALHERAEALAPEEARGRLLLKKAFTLEQKTDYESALETLGEAAPWIESAGEPRLRFGLGYNSVIVLLHLGRVAEVAGLLAEVRAFAQELGGRPDQTRVRWLDGRVAYEQGNHAEAIAAFEQARRAFESLGSPCDVALVTLDLALLRRDQGRWSEVRRLAAAVVEVFAHKDIHREALAAAILFEEAATKEAVTGDLVRRLQGYLTAAQGNPKLRFEA